MMNKYTIKEKLISSYRSKKISIEDSVQGGDHAQAI